MECATLFPSLVGKVGVILTSPPYLNAQTYSKDNWLRLWLLGYDHRGLHQSYIETGSVLHYGQKMKLVFEQLAKMLRPGGLLICVAGDVRLRSRGTAEQRVFATGDFLKRLCTDEGLGFRLKAEDKRFVPYHRRYLNALKSTTGHAERELTERTFIVVKEDAETGASS